MCWISPVAVGAEESLSTLAIPSTSPSTDLSRAFEAHLTSAGSRPRSKLARVWMIGRSRGVTAVGKGVSAPVGKAEGQGARYEQQEKGGGRHIDCVLSVQPWVSY